MNRWAERGDGEFTRTLRDGREAKVLNRELLIRAAVDGQMVDDVFFSAREAMEAIDSWDAGEEPLTFHQIDKLWVCNTKSRYSRKSGAITLTVSKEACGSWKLDREARRCFDSAESARRYADEHYP
ncbi:hypothetical protein [Novosphingobium sp.]|uniref:hypothetical protein n=1 Tax=Novosphingobium sp. TaxID=1874826 RepID=UPI002625E50A|nr:hypothetical protein [Novosphingobium sp.]